jgi:hypothetical protein
MLPQDIINGYNARQHTATTAYDNHKMKSKYIRNIMQIDDDISKSIESRNHQQMRPY